MTEVRVVLTTCRDMREAERIAEAVVAERLAACANLVPGVRSIYRWEGKIEHSEEILIVIKTAAAQFAALEKRIKALHSYTCPEIVSIPIQEGFQPYLDWIRQNTGAL